MAKAKHTPGPWAIHPLNPSVIVVEGRGALATQIGIGEVYERASATDDGRDYAEVTANARLIAAAPELLAAAEQAFAALVGAHASDDSVQGRARARLREAIAKATGS